MSELPPEQYKHLMQAIADYSLDGKEAELKGMERAIFILIKPQLDANESRYQNSKKGGRKRHEEPSKELPKEELKEPALPSEREEETKEEPNTNQTNTEALPNVSVSDSVNVSANENDNVSGKPVFSKAEALNPNTQNGEKIFQQFKTAWNDNCKPKCHIIDTLHMTRDEQNDWVAVKERIDDPFKVCKAMQNYGGILGNPEYEIDGHKGYSLLSFLIKGVEWYTDEARPFERCRKKQAGPIRETVPDAIDADEDFSR
jgi:hypothetical protein